MCIYVHIHIYIYICVHVYTHIHIYTYIHTYICITYSYTCCIRCTYVHMLLLSSLLRVCLFPSTSFLAPLQYPYNSQDSQVFPCYAGSAHNPIHIIHDSPYNSQDQAASTMFVYHLAGLGLEAWDYAKQYYLPYYTILYYTIIY